MVCFWAAAVAYHALNTLVGWKQPERKHELIRIAGFAACCLVVFGALVWLNGWSYENMNPAGYAAFEDARGRYVDFPHVTYEQDPAFFASLGWDKEIYDLVDRSCFIDPHVTADSLNAVLAHDTGAQVSLTQRVATALHYGEAFFRGNGPAEYMLVAPVLIALWALFRFLSDRRRWVEALILFGIALGSFLLCLYLCFAERLILRAFQVIAIPAAAMLLLLCLRIRPAGDRSHESKPKIALRVSLLLLTLFALSWGITKNMLWIGQFQPQQQMQNMRTAERYAMDHPKNVYVCMPTFIFNSEAFKTYPQEKPTNLLDWGDTGIYSGWKTRQLALNGVQPFTPEVFQQENVYLMGTFEGKELQVLIDYLVKDAGAKGLERVEAFGDGYAVFQVVY